MYTNISSIKLVVVTSFLTFTKNIADTHTYDGYTRSNRKKSSNNLRDTDHAKEKYQEVVDLVKYGKSKLHYLSESDYYEGYIDVTKGDDWNQTAPIDLNPTLNDFKKTIGDFLAWEVSNLLQNQSDEDTLGK